MRDYLTINTVVTSTIRLRFDGRSTKIIGLSHSDLTHQFSLTRTHADLFIYLGRSGYGRNECRKMTAARSNCSRIEVELKLNRIRFLVKFKVISLFCHPVNVALQLKVFRKPLQF